MSVRRPACGLSACLPTCLLVCLPVFLSACLPVDLSACLSVRMPACLPVLYLPAYLFSTCLPTCPLPACLHACLPVCLPTCLLEIIDYCRINNRAHLLILRIHDCGIAELQLRTNILLKSCGIAIVEELPLSCGIALADLKKSCACPPVH
jgi:hypothetical protein